MTDLHPIIGWEQVDPVPDGHAFNDYLQVKNGRLFWDGFDLAHLFLGDRPDQGPGQILPSPLEVVYLPLIRQKIATMNQLFADVITEVGYNGRFHYAYASKANAAAEVIQTTLGAGSHHEMSSSVDVDIAHLMIEQNLLAPDKMVLCNGFKATGTTYAANILRLKSVHEQVIPIIEDLGELSIFIDSSHHFEVGLRQKSYGPQITEEEMDAANSRFGVDLTDLWKAADYIAAAPNLVLKMYHFMVGSQLTTPDDFVAYLTPGIHLYARLKQRHPHLSIFNFGGGMPAPMTLDFTYDYEALIRLLLTTTQEICDRYHVPVPDIMGEFGRYTTAEHGAHLFKVITTKDNNSEHPWYIIDGSIMTSFPDSWALGQHFIVLPLNHLDKPFQRVQLGGITCDSDDVYPPKSSQSPLYLPIETDDLYVGFFSIGAYQEMLGGVRGSKHCVLPEAFELVIDRKDNAYQFEILPGQMPKDVLHNLGYHTS